MASRQAASWTIWRSCSSTRASNSLESTEYVVQPRLTPTLALPRQGEGNRFLDTVRLVAAGWNASLAIRDGVVVDALAVGSIRTDRAPREDWIQPAHCLGRRIGKLKGQSE